MNLDTSYGDSSVNTATPGVPGQPGAGGMNLGGFGDVLNQLAARRAWEKQQQLALEQQKQALAEAAQKQEMQLARERWEAQQAAAQAAKNEHEQDRHQRQIEAQAPPPHATRWMKNLPGIGPVEVAPGTFGAYPAGNVSDVDEAHAGNVGLRPGLVGSSFEFKAHQDNSGSGSTPGAAAAAAPRKDEQMDAYKAWGHV